MKSFALALAAAAAVGAFAAPAYSAVLVEVGTSGLSGSNQISWTPTSDNNGTVSVSGITTVLNFNDALYNDGVLGQEAVLTIVASTNGAGSLDQVLPNFTQAGIDGYFEFRSTDLSTVLLRGDFTNFWLTGITGDTSGNLTSVGGQLELTSSVADLSFITGDNAVFGFTNINPPFGITGDQLDAFDASNLTGSFGGQAVIPEPGTWALMILGFGGAGAMLRRRRGRLAYA